MCQLMRLLDIEAIRDAFTLMRMDIYENDTMLSFIQNECRKGQSLKDISGKRGEYIDLNSWRSAPRRRCTRNAWPLDFDLYENCPKPFSEAVWVQEYKYNWESDEHLVQGYWAPPDFQHPATCLNVSRESVETPLGILRRSSTVREFKDLPIVPPRMGYRAVWGALDLVYRQLYKPGEWGVLGMPNKNGACDGKLTYNPTGSNADVYFPEEDQYFTLSN
ncbi:uncharacterized protein LOC122499718 [Leptopilina heterotoma]|uniref:uncharacterized protein LOC122499718 n=1 Tax=Leptopilina heterotoma TaxID=63436 RepID=UPI001CA87D9E|nr:uncharacterized protein LOC122499718 [Leptopilina heterotoma]